jgi:hypothetical protein
MSEPYIDPKYRPERFSKKHHYLPVFYLLGFTNTGNTFHIYDKITGQVLENQAPKSKYFEKHLNNYKFDGEMKFTMEEPYFTPNDSLAAPLFVKMRDPDYHGDTLTDLEKFQILGFLMTLYWRLPGTNARAVELMKKESISNKYVGFFNGDRQLSDDEVPEIRDGFLNDEQNQRLYKMGIPLTNGAMEEIYKLHGQWHLYTMPAPPHPLVVGDDPFLMKNDNFSLDQLIGELIFPLAENRLLVLAPKAPSFLDGTLAGLVNLAVLVQAKRYISYSSKAYLLELVASYEHHKKLGVLNGMMKALFDTLHSQAEFANYEVYLADIQKQFPGRF